MNNNKLLVYDFNELYKILSEIKDKINFEVSNITEADIEKIGINKDYLIITKKKISHIRNQFIINDFPISVYKLLEKLNISFLKLKYSEQSQIKVGAYIIDLNSREMIQQNLKIKLTEKETNIIIFISNSTKPMSVSDLQTKVWHHQSELETHTVETRIYRLRKKIFNKFKDSNFIISKKDGYSIS